MEGWFVMGPSVRAGGSAVLAPIHSGGLLGSLPAPAPLAPGGIERSALPPTAARVIGARVGQSIASEPATGPIPASSSGTEQGQV